MGSRANGVCAMLASLSVFAAMVLPASAKPPAQHLQRPGETVQGPRSCMTHEGAGDKLRAEYGEKVLGRGVSGDGTLVEIYLSPNGSFTVIKTTPAGLSCVVDFGDGWQTLDQLEQVGFTPDTLPRSAAH